MIPPVFLAKAILVLIAEITEMLLEDGVQLVLTTGGISSLPCVGSERDLSRHIALTAWLSWGKALCNTLSVEALPDAIDPAKAQSLFDSRIARNARASSMFPI